MRLSSCPPWTRCVNLLSDETAETAVCKDPDGLFSLPIPTNWTAEQAVGYAILSRPDHEITLKMLAIERDEYVKGLSVRERGKDDPVTPETLMQTGSTTKSMTTF